MLTALQQLTTEPQLQNSRTITARTHQLCLSDSLREREPNLPRFDLDRKTPSRHVSKLTEMSVYIGDIRSHRDQGYAYLNGGGAWE